MRFSPRTWSLLSVLLFIAAAFFWMKGNEIEERKRQLAPAIPAPSAAPGSGTNAASAPAPVDLLSPKGASGAALAKLGFKDDFIPLRLRNTPRSVDELARDDRALLFANALIDTAAGLELEIPEHLRAADEPGTFVVQWHGPADAQFRALLADHQAEIVSYVPNNAYLVKASRAQAEALRAAVGVQAVAAFEPYYKLELGLLQAAVEQQLLPVDQLLRLTLIPGALDEALRQVAALGGETLAEEASPFGPQLIVRPAGDSLAALARLPSVQGIEPDLSRKPAADLTRIVLGVATNSTASNYMSLTGSNVWVNINDIAIDTNHPALRNNTFATAPFPVRPNILNSDTNGHGTFVAGLIVGSGASAPATTNAPIGSDTNASFRGLAPAAKVFAQPIEPAGEEVYPKIKDTWLIETAAATNYVALRRTNSLISNNSWTYTGAGYDSAAARYDAAVRDALPGASGPQPLLFVFAAGNAGFGDEDGGGGQLGRILSPGSAKNVITVGALESYRLIQFGITNTNTLTFTNSDGTIETNEFPEVEFPFAAMTDSSNQVASFSSRGNVGIGIEGGFGRFKPDVVAPGTMLISARSRSWNITNSVDTNTPFGSGLATLHTNKTEYRYDSGTTYAAANVSGMLALIQEYFESKAPNGVRGPRMSPALMKALLINGARSLTEYYDIAVNAAANFQGWGLPNLPASLASFSTNGHASIDEKRWRLRFIDQDPAAALATGESRTWRVTLSTNASVLPFRMTLVWTDPPGNPAVGVKLVNDLDLVVTNLESGMVFYGNNFFPGNDFTEATDPDDGITAFDFVNNVENVLIRNPRQFGREFSVTVRARRVNVNSVSGHMAASGRPNDVVQDFALVIASDLGADRSLNIDEPDDQVDYSEVDVFDSFVAPTRSDVFGRPAIGVITNGLPLLTERVGANPTHFGTNGNPAQWNFYVFTNAAFSNSLVTARAGSNVAFVTFNPPNLSRPREIEADIDVYVSKNPALTNLVPSVLRAAAKSTEAGGTETVVFTNAVIGDVYYIGVKSEDQQAAEFSLLGVSSDGPFEEERNGRIILNGVPVSGTVLDGSPNRPSAATFVAVGLSSRRVARTIVTNQVTHENFGDLVGVLAHQGVRTVLNNHTILAGTPTITNQFIAYDDLVFQATTPAPNVLVRPSDGPGTLADFGGTKIVGSWIFEMIDNAPSHTGYVQQVTIGIDPLQNQLLHAQSISATNRGFETLFFPIDVGVTVTNIDVRLSNIAPSTARLRLMLRKDAIPQTNAFDFSIDVPPATGFTYPSTERDAPISPGTYFLAVQNLRPEIARYDLVVNFGFDNSTSNRFNFTNGVVTVRDDAVSSQTIRVNDDKLIAGVRVGVNMRHPRSSDTVLSLISPQGTRVLLAEQRGYTNALGFGTRTTSTNAATNLVTTLYHTVFTDDTNLARLPLKFVDLGSPVGLSGSASLLTNGFERAVSTNYLAGGVGVDGWTVIGGAGQMVSVITSETYAHSGSNLLTLGTGAIRTNIAAAANQAHKLRFAVRGAPMLTLFNTGVDDSGAALPVGSEDPHYRLVRSANTNFPGPIPLVFAPPAVWNANNATSRWIAPLSTPPNPLRFGEYRYRTYVSMYEQNTLSALLRFKWGAADDLGAQVFLNGQLQNIAPRLPASFASGPYNGTINAFRPGLNIIDFVLDDGYGAFRLEVDPSTSLVPKDEFPSLVVTINGQNFSPPVGTDWSNVTLDFVPTAANTTITFASDFGEVWLDTVSVERTGDVFVRPEEPLEIIQGERSIGDWTLEVRDARSGAVLPASDVLSWELDVDYAQPSILAERLGRGANFPFTPGQINNTNRMRGGVLFTNQVHYFAIYPCPDASFVRVTLSGFNNFDAIELLADHSGLPTGDPDTDDFVIIRNNENPGSPGGRAEFYLDWDLPAPATLIPGKPFFIALRNRLLNTTNAYSLKIDSDGSCPLPPPPPLLANQSVFSVATAAMKGEATEGDTYEVNVSEGAQNVSFEVEAEGDAMIVAQKGSVPTRENYSHVQNTPGSGSETLTIGASAGLRPGVWYVRVLSNAGEPIGYSITARGDISGPANRTQLSVSESNGAIQLSWNTVAGAAYRLESSTDLQNWSERASFTGTGGIVQHSETTSGVTQRFYRVVQAAP